MSDDADIPHPYKGGKLFRIVENGLVGRFGIFQVELHGGPFDGCETMAGNTTVVFHGGQIYRLNDEGEFWHTGSTL